MTFVTDFRKFLIWLFGSIAIFGCISTLVVYVMYDGGSTTNCNANDTECIQQNQNIEANKRDNEILRIISPTSIAVGITVVLLMRCWERNSLAAANFGRGVEGEGNAGYNDQEAPGMDAPPPYADALEMDAVLEAHGTFPDEAPPKYDEIICHQSEAQPNNHSPIPGGSQQTIDVVPDIEEGDIVENGDDEDTTAPQVIEPSGSEDPSPPAREPTTVHEVATSAARSSELNGVEGPVVANVEGQNSSSQNIRISVLHRDNHLSTEEASNMSVQADELSTAQSQGTEAAPSSLPQTRGNRNDSIHCTVTMGDNTEQGGRGQSTVVINSLCLGSQTNVEVHCSTSSSIGGSSPGSVAVSLNIRDRNGRNDVLEQHTRTADITHL